MYKSKTIFSFCFILICRIRNVFFAKNCIVFCVLSWSKCNTMKKLLNCQLSCVVIIFRTCTYCFWGSCAHHGVCGGLWFGAVRLLVFFLIELGLFRTVSTEWEKNAEVWKSALKNYPIRLTERDRDWPTEDKTSVAIARQIGIFSNTFKNSQK